MYKFLAAHKREFLYIPLVLYWFTLLLLTSLPSSAMPPTELSDKIQHFLAFFGLGFLLNLALYFEQKYPLLNRYPALFTFIAGAAYAALDEIHQKFIPGRMCDILDWVADVIGLTIGIILINILIRFFIPKEQTQTE